MSVFCSSAIFIHWALATAADALCGLSGIICAIGEGNLFGEPSPDQGKI